MKTLSLGDRGTWVFYLQLALRRAGQEVSLDGNSGRRPVWHWGVSWSNPRGNAG